MFSSVEVAGTATVFTEEDFDIEDTGEDGFMTGLRVEDGGELRNKLLILNLLEYVGVG